MTPFVGPFYLLFDFRKDALEKIGITGANLQKDAFSIETQAYKAASSLVSPLPADLSYTAAQAML